MPRASPTAHPRAVPSDFQLLHTQAGCQAFLILPLYQVRDITKRVSGVALHMCVLGRAWEAALIRPAMCLVRATQLRGPMLLVDRSCLRLQYSDSAEAATVEVQQRPFAAAAGGYRNCCACGCHLYTQPRCLRLSCPVLTVSTWGPQGHTVVGALMLAHTEPIPTLADHRWLAAYLPLLSLYLTGGGLVGACRVGLGRVGDHRGASLEVRDRAGDRGRAAGMCEGGSPPLEDMRYAARLTPLWPAAAVPNCHMHKLMNPPNSPRQRRARLSWSTSQKRSRRRSA